MTLPVASGGRKKQRTILVPKPGMRASAGVRPGDVCVGESGHTCNRVQWVGVKANEQAESRHTGL